MRSWRVGSFSMGAALVFLGVFLLLAQLLKWDPAVAMVSWWPILLIILGIEILIYLGWKKDENQRVKYDFISIIFISIIGTFGLGMTVLNQTGLLEMSKQFVSAEERTMDLPKLEEVLSEDIQRVVVDTGSYSLNIEATVSKEAVMFGTYRGDIGKGHDPFKNVADYALIEKQGDTLYIKLKELPTNRFVHNGGWIEATLLIPANKKLEIVGGTQELNMKPRSLQAEWSVTNANYVNLEFEDDANILVEAIEVNEIRDGKKSDLESVNEDTQGSLTETFTYGSGEHKIKITNSYSVQLN